MHRKILLLIFVLLFGCRPSFSGPRTTLQEPDETSSFVSGEKEGIKYASPEILKYYEAGIEKDYILGPGDVLEIVSPRHKELSGEYVISPYGTIAIFLGGEIDLSCLTRGKAEDSILEKLDKYYDLLSLTLKIKSYKNNKVYVLGRVDNPGIIRFEGRPTLLEALSVAAPFPPVQSAAFLSKCAIMRGKDQILWIDLQELLRRGNMKLNINLANNDIIYIPDPQDSNVFIMGEVREPGSYEIRDVLTLLNAIGMAGGLTEDAVPSDIKLIRNRGKGGDVIKIDLDKLMASADFSQNYLLKNNDIIYVPRKGITIFNYYLRQIDPFIQLLIVGESLKTNK
ncbi:MAG: polysaccharide biosynthesis/export family protein [Thermodesulfobacteriota bacterium]|nr:polysaccharide biosynthesis/export family protein [Thermodesulfobacteriota bacterium]